MDTKATFFVSGRSRYALGRRPNSLTYGGKRAFREYTIRSPLDLGCLTFSDVMDQSSYG
jgi:hypothetical protein